MDAGSYPPGHVLQPPQTQRCLGVNVGRGDAGLQGTKESRGGWLTEGQEEFSPLQP